MSPRKPVVSTVGKIFKRTAIAAGICTLSLSGSALAATTLTEFTINTGVTGVSTGSFTISNSVLYDVSQLTGSGFNYNYAAQLFTPSTSGSYTFGMASAGVDTVMILYSGSFNPATPGTNAIALDDDSDGLGAGGVVMGTCGGSAGLCPKMTEALTANTDYYVVISTFGNNQPVVLPIEFYVYGEPVGVGGLPPPPALSVYGSSFLQSNRPAFGAARVIDANANLLNVFAGANLSGDEAISNAASQTIPLLTGSTQLATRSAMSGIHRVIQARLDSNRGLSSGDSTFSDHWFWMKPFGSWADQNDRKGVSGFEAQTWGVAFGADAAISRDTRLGLSFAYAKANVDGNSSVAPNSADVDVYQLLGYGSYAIDPRTEVNFQFGLGQNKNSGSRQLTFAGSTAKSNYDSLTATAGVGIARTYALGERTTIIPSVRADYTWIKDDGYTERGAGLFNLDVNDQETDALVISVDGKLVHQINKDLSVDALLGLGYDTLAEQNSITASFAGAPDAAFTTDGLDPDPWILRAGVGLASTTTNGMEISARYDAEYRDDYLNQTASIKLRWGF
jgi:outer membrane autotransporter protein